MSEHRIRLAGPWQFRAFEPAGSARTERLPLSGAGAGLSGAGRVHLIRGFHAPPRLSSGVRLHLAFVGNGSFVVQLNGEVLGFLPELSCGVLAGETIPERCCQIPFRLLRSFNEVQFEVGAGAAEDWSLESVWLVISESAGQPIDEGES